ncbi:17.4 kDa class I heat shock protein 3 [Zea mays]|uniref:Uncharacterized protein n=1 Tax=Zea mays TaxID=4577 RepID=B4G273_MAIZE|nr:17.4 kDa class I heat shock protein 3 [Zea mays]ACF88466.1 unknown [Zea mays]|eukprot:NP_001150508.1 17.4 kDa class I heat shock protein 3 [Zea mays]
MPSTGPPPRRRPWTGWRPRPPTCCASTCRDSARTTSRSRSTRAKCSPSGAPRPRPRRRGRRTRRRGRCGTWRSAASRSSRGPWRCRRTCAWTGSGPAWRTGFSPSLCPRKSPRPGPSPGPSPSPASSDESEAMSGRVYGAVLNHAANGGYV